MYSCPLCTKTFKVSTNLHHHVATHTKEKPHKCLKCPAVFGRKDSLNKHIKSVHDGIKDIKIKTKNLQCPSCSYKCDSKTALQIHLQKHSTEPAFSCSLTDCAFKTKHKSALLRHVRDVHSGEHPYECPSDGCPYKGKSRGHLRSHLRTHSNEKPFTCKVPGCSYTCKTKQYLKGHISRAHTAEKLLKCSTCDFHAKTRSNLRQHQLTHMTVKHFQCQAPNCGFASHQKCKLELHMDRNHRKKDIRCTEPGCNFKCGSIILLKVHLKRHVLPIWKCPGDSCSYSTKEKISLAQHISRFHVDLHSATVVGSRISDLEIVGTADAMDTLHCRFPDCGFQTKFQHHYDRHKITHKKDEKRQHVCSFCFSRFSNLSTLKAHVQWHIGERPYNCSHCKYAAVHSSELSKHARKSHHIRVIPRGKEDEVTKCGTCAKSCLSYSEFVLHSMSHLQPVVVLERLHVHVV